MRTAKEEFDGDAKFLTREWGRVKTKYERMDKLGLLRLVQLYNSITGYGPCGRSQVGFCLLQV